MSDESIFPIGAVFAFGGMLPDSEVWIPCDGRELETSEYEQLFDVIEYTYGGEDGMFNVPDYRGAFLRGAQQDPDKGVGVHEDWRTAPPNSPFIGRFVHLPNSTMNSGAGTSNDSARAKGAKTIETCTSGGDGDTRPANVYVTRYIRAL